MITQQRELLRATRKRQMEFLGQLMRRETLKHLSLTVQIREKRKGKNKREDKRQ